VAFFVAVIALGVDLAYLFQRGPRRVFLRLGSALTLVYLLGLFGLIIWGNGVTIPLLRTGFFTAIGVTVLLALHIADVISSRG
jgi:hypothetical protein